MTRSAPKLRYVNRWSGAVALAAVAFFFAALLQAGVLQDLFRRTLELRVVLPESGVSGLSAGAQVEVLGTTAGRVEELILDPEAGFHARVSIEESMEPFVRSDSVVYIRKQFGIAGAAYMEILRGYEAPLDWDYAVLTARVEAAPAASIGELIEDLRARILPVLDDTHRAIQATAQLVEGLVAPDSGLQVALGNLSTVTTEVAEGKGNVGRLLRDDRLMVELETTVAGLKDTVSSFSVIVANLQSTSSDVASMTAGFGAQSRKLPEMIDTMNTTLKSLNGVMQEVSSTMPEITTMVKNSADASSTMPTLMAQTQQTLSELERLLVQLQGNWLIGGGGDLPPKRIDRLSPIEARP